MSQAPVGLFDSGVGGLSVLREVRARLPDEARAAFEHGRGLPPAERAELRERLKAMTPEERREWLRTHRNQRERKP